MFQTPSLTIRSNLNHKLKPLLRAFPLAMATSAALLLCAPVQAQTDTTPPVSGKAQDNKVSPAPTGGTPSPMTGSMGANSGAKADMGMTKPKDDMVNPAPKGGTAKTADMRTQDKASMGGSAMGTANGVTPNPKDNMVNPAPKGGTAKTADARAQAKMDKKAAADAKRSARKMPGSPANSGDANMQPSGSMGAVPPSPSK